jgi:uncharacterized membrane protein SpoIIM required for sporulation
MNEEALVNRRLAEWRRLEELCSKSELRVQWLKQEELFEFIRLYRKASSDLATIRTRSANEPLALYLNNVVARAHGILYKRPSQKILDAFSALVLNVAQTFRRNRVFFWASFGIFFGASLFAFALCRLDSSYVAHFSGGSGAVFDQWKKGVHEERGVNDSVMMSFFYAGNNPKVSILTGAIGAGSMGIYSLILLFTNGALLGALASEMHSVGKLGFLLSSIAPHGVPELSGIIFSGAAGLRFGWAIFCPGVYSRGESLRRCGSDGLILIVTGVLLCFIAAPIEGFFSFNPKIPQFLKVVFAVISLAMWVGFWSFYGKEKDQSKEESVNAAYHS